MENAIRAITKRCFFERVPPRSSPTKGREGPHSSATRQVPRKYLLCSQKTSKVFGPCGIRVESGVRFAVCNRWQTNSTFNPYPAGAKHFAGLLGAEQILPGHLPC